MKKSIDKLANKLANQEANRFAFRVLRIVDDEFTYADMFLELDVFGLCIKFRVAHVVLNVNLERGYKISDDGFYRFGVGILSHIHFVVP